MYTDTKGYTYYDKIKLDNQQKRPISSFINLNSSLDKPSNNKTLRWNMEESKENISFCKTPNYNTPYSPSYHTVSTAYQHQYLTPKKEEKKELRDYSNTFGTKSFKSINFSNGLELQYNYNKSYGNFQKNLKNNEQKSKETKIFAMSLNYKSTLKDLIPCFKGEQTKLEEKDTQISNKRMRFCRSQKKITTDLDKSNPMQNQSNNKNQLLSSKSYKKLADFLADDKTYKPYQNKSLVASRYEKNGKSIKEESKLKVYKTLSYKDRIDNQFQYEKSKKHLTTDNQKPKDLLSMHSLSIADFQLGSCKGEGAFGQVFSAIHKATKMLVAIKKIPKQKVKYMLDQLINEIKIQMFLDHPNIVKLYGFFDDLTHFYIVMEYMEGGSLFSHIKKNKKLTPEETKTRLRQVCLGLKQMHDNSILHRDIKPQNIVITNDVCKLCDFGWSAVCKDRRTTYCGTLDYISPQIVGGQGYDDSVDIWCLGVLAYEMVCGKTPFYNISRTQTMKKIMNVKYQYPPELTPRVKSFVDKILKRNPEDRLGIDQVLRDGFLAE